MEQGNFNIRVYGLIVHEHKLLLTDEFRLGICMTKFPGGGLQFGEGPVDCLKRECLEELNQEVEILSHYYTTDYFQQSELLPGAWQILNIYYRARLKGEPAFRTTEKVFDFEHVDGVQTFRWADHETLSSENMTLPIDRKVVAMILSDPESLFNGFGSSDN